ncbi:scaffolding protein [Lactobacillus sp. CBA3605]|uniref:capsid assembly scaffolding protein Gp46 family protein n=1 Tax=Lactobacillus sp. CBA3605 TaxID=2099788 RepID=UPI000CFCE089|nr:DUF4355 domain-containing protein [Lactobacillus sp. CBA3605]AVK60538.1 scaffolding protein [Lactobacillus sp. CBA3605]
MKKLLKIKMNLQMFAEGGDGAGGDGDNAADAAADNDNAGQNDSKGGNDEDGKPAAPFKSFANEKEWQSSVDKLIQTAIKTHDEKQASAAEQKKDYDKMSDLEKAQYDRDNLQTKLAEAERHGKIIENRAKMTEQLGADGLPTGLIAMFGESTLAADDGLGEAYKAIKEVFKDNLQKAIDKRITASATTPPTGTSDAKKSEGATVAEQLNGSQQGSSSSLWTTK